MAANVRSEPNSARSKKSGQSPSGRSIRCVGAYERLARERGFTCIAGVDEVGRGCLFGPVFAAAVVLHPDRPIRKLHDSKILAPNERARLAHQIKSRCISWSIGAADVFEIDQINILQASRLAMKRAVESLSLRPDYLLLDAVRIEFEAEQLALIDGDARCRAIAAASIVAKVHRDACLEQWHAVFPQYNLQSNKGYSTPDHKRALRKYGPTFMHRYSFWPVRALSEHTHWTGYLHGGPVQGELFAFPEAVSHEQVSRAAGSET